MTTKTTKEEWSKRANPPVGSFESLDDFEFRMKTKNDEACRQWGIPKWVGRFDK